MNTGWDHEFDAVKALQCSAGYATITTMPRRTKASGSWWCSCAIAKVENGVGGSKSVWMLVVLTILLVLNQAHRQLYAVLIPGGIQCPNNGTSSNASDWMRQGAHNIDSMSYLWNYVGDTAGRNGERERTEIFFKK